jgi:hypothetical protein
LRRIAPRLIVPSHCTGWKATHEIARALPDAYVPNSVGTTFLISSRETAALPLGAVTSLGPPSQSPSLGAPLGAGRWAAWLLVLVALAQDVTGGAVIPVKQVRVNGTELAYVEWGQGQPVVLVLGGVGDYRLWTSQMPALSTRYRVIAYSFRYHYPNAPAGADSDYTVPLHAGASPRSSEPSTGDRLIWSGIPMAATSPRSSHATIPIWFGAGKFGDAVGQGSPGDERGGMRRPDGLPSSREPTGCRRRGRCIMRAREPCTADAAQYQDPRGPRFGATGAVESRPPWTRSRYWS